jgi:hypothetical protein
MAKIKITKRSVEALRVTSKDYIVFDTLVGEGLAMIGKLLGHTQVQTTARYAHLASDPVKQAATKISDRLALALCGSIDDASAKKPQQANRLSGDTDVRPLLILSSTARSSASRTGWLNG